MIQTMRWFGPNDPVSLMDIRQAGCTGIVTALHQIPVGDVWNELAILERINIVEADNYQFTALNWEVVESLPVHEDIKKGLPSREIYIEYYKISLRNLAKCGIKIVCYNFMPVLDWSRTNLSYEMPDGSRALRFVWEDFALFDLYILKRPNAQNDYVEEVQTSAKKKFDSMTEDEILGLRNTVLLGLPGSEEAFELENFQGLLNNYAKIGNAELRQNLHYFIQQVAPVAEELGVKLCIHPDDPPFPLMGLSRVVSTENDLAQLMAACEVNANGITFCTGSLGVRADNNLLKMIERFGDRIHFIHLRTTKREENLPGNVLQNFHEAAHLAGDVDMYEVVKALVLEEKKRKIAGRIDAKIPMRPDHGHQMLDDLHERAANRKTYPGYSAIGRLKALAELRGLELGILRNLENK